MRFVLKVVGVSLLRFRTLYEVRCFFVFWCQIAGPVGFWMGREAGTSGEQAGKF